MCIVIFLTFFLQIFKCLFIFVQFNIKIEYPNQLGVRPVPVSLSTSMGSSPVGSGQLVWQVN